MKLVGVAITLVLIGMTSTIMAAEQRHQGSFYAGLKLTQFTYDEDGISQDAKPKAIIARAGYFIANYIALEGRLGRGLSDDTVRVPDGFGGTVGVDVEVDRLFGIYVVGHLPLGEVASIYGLIGFTDVKATFSANGFSVSGSDSGLSYGIGVEVNPTPQLGLHIEYTQYLDESGYDASAISLGGIWYF